MLLKKISFTFSCLLANLFFKKCLCLHKETSHSACYHCMSLATVWKIVTKDWFMAGLPWFWRVNNCDWDVHWAGHLQQKNKQHHGDTTSKLLLTYSCYFCMFCYLLDVGGTWCSIVSRSDSVSIQDRQSQNTLGIRWISGITSCTTILR